MIRAARRTEAKPMIGMYAESGRGKSLSALYLARGFVGPTGRIVMVETEAGRGEVYADMIPGGYDVISIRGNFAPQRFGEAITEAEQGDAKALIIDSASHEWESDGGVLSMAAENQASGKKGPLVWQMPKTLHKRHFMLRLLSTPIPLVIVCMRAKFPMREVSKDGRKEWVRSEQLEPIQADDVLYEMMVHGWIDAMHRFHVTKYTRPDLQNVIKDSEPISIETGRALAQWASGSNPAAQVGSEQTAGGAAASQEAPQPPQPAAPSNSDLQSDLILRTDKFLSDAAEHGSLRLQQVWTGLPKDMQKALKAALDRRHKPRAQEVDQQSAQTLPL